MADLPQRIQRQRTKGWRLPANSVVVTRPSVFSNPFNVAECREAGFLGTNADLAGLCVASFERWLKGSDRDWMGPKSEARRTAILARLPELRGKNLACWCRPGDPCHADVLLAMANEEQPHA